MAVYRRKGSDIYSYDFYSDGVRYNGSTGHDDLEKAIDFETTVKNELVAISAFCRAIIKRARRAVPQRPTASAGYVYMIRTGYFIKIGYSNDPAQRLKSINTASPDGCELIFCVRGTLKLQRQMHREFEACHYKKEWFFLCGKLKRFVEEVERFAAQTAPPVSTPADIGSASSA